MSNSIANKIIVITGAAGVIGESFVKSISENDGIAIIADINFEAAELLAIKIGARSEAFALDITNVNSITSLINSLTQKYGRIDAVVNNAYPHNKNYGRKLEDITYEDFCQNIDMHLGGYFLVAQQFCFAFKKQGHGNVINMSSIYGSIAPIFQLYDGTKMTMPVEYAAIKSAIEHLTRYFAQYFKGAGIRVNSLSPGGILANQPDSFLEAYNRRSASKGMLDAKDVVGALMFLLSDESRFVTGQNLIVDDGFSL
jgi:NAD(P)-dependent dehydrogenase (short-subunit alcohol dehydrogenase family)